MILALGGSAQLQFGRLASRGSHDGIMYSTPFNANKIIRIDTNTDAVALIGSLAGWGKWRGGAVAPSGIVYAVPARANTVLKITPGASPSEDKVEQITVTSGDTQNKWHGAIVAPDGIVYAFPSSKTTFLKIGVAQCS